jgi:hypothetical protein
MADYLGGNAMGRTIRILAVLGLTVGLVGCQSFNVRTDWDPAVSFDVFQRYFWIEPPEVEGASPFADNTLLRKRVRFVLEFELKERGFARTEERINADFLVSYSVILDERLKVNGSYAGVGGGYHRGRYGGFGTIHSTASIRNYQESTLIIDFLDPNNDDLVWRGWGSGIVRTRDRNARRGRLEKGIRAILDKFPPKEN